MSKNLKNKKKGFTLIELVIVLAVLAIIALIAIPNFNKVRTDSQEKADKQTCEVIEKVTTMAIANQDMTVTATAQFIVTPSTGGSVSVPDNPTGITWKPSSGKTNYETALKEVKKPQQKNRSTYTVDITLDGNGAETVVAKVTPPTPTKQK